MSTTKSNNRNNILKNGTNMLISALLVLIISLSVLRFISEPQDNTRCHAMLNEGKWMTEEYKQWQPSGCMAKTYNDEDISSCVGHSKIIYIGDSIMREQYYTLTEHFGFTKPTEAVIHKDQKVYSKQHNLTIEMWWDPFLDTNRTINLLLGKHETRPSMLVMGSGIWYMRQRGTEYLRGWKEAIDRIFDASLHRPIADTLLLSPVEIVQRDLLIPERVKTLTVEKTTIMNNYLRERESHLHETVTPLVVPFVWNEIVTHSNNQTSDGLHFHTPVTEAQLQLAMNYHCNEQVVGKSDFPMNKTCCFTYPATVWYQNAIFAFFLVFVPIGICFLYAPSGGFVKYIQQIFPSNYDTLFALTVFGLSIIYMYLGDRSQLFGKIYKQYDVSTFSILIAVIVTLGLVTIKSNQDESNDAGFLNRDQTDEWKGWMQLVILIYHFVGASRISGIYNLVRVLVAAYLFQTGYGHFFYFYKKADFGIARVLNVMVRLNLLTCVLAYSMKTNYLFYYFSPLVSFWFAVIWITMRIMSSYNQSAPIILAKIVVMALVTGFIIHFPGVLEATFHALSFLFKIQWNVTEWRFRLSLDAWIVYIGMLCAYVTIKLSELKISNNYPGIWKTTKIASLVVSIIGLAGFFIFELSQTKTSYNVYHPYVSWIPILSFAIIRNYTRFGRNTYSQFFTFMGKISLETFIGQFHMWLAADTKGLLVVIPNASWVIKTQTGWWVNLAVSSLIFFFVCHHLSQATGVLTRWICSGVVAQQNASFTDTNNAAGSAANKSMSSKTADSVPLLPTNRTTEIEEDLENDSCSSSSSILIDNKPGELQIENASEESLVDIDEEWNDDFLYSHNSKSVWYKSVYQNYWIRSITCLIIMGIINRFCS